MTGSPLEEQPWFWSPGTPLRASLLWSQPSVYSNASPDFLYVHRRSRHVHESSNNDHPGQVSSLLADWCVQKTPRRQSSSRVSGTSVKVSPIPRSWQRWHYTRADPKAWTPPSSAALTYYRLKSDSVIVALNIPEWTFIKIYSLAAPIAHYFFQLKTLIKIRHYDTQ